ncbi:MAG: hypothetical protein QM533_01460 [Cytophagales bacterium]|nr:hypothetical protein [Cytophagales bacterium]
MKTKFLRVFSIIFALFICTCVPAQTMWPTDVVDATYARKSLDKFFKTNVEVLASWQGGIQSAAPNDWAGVVRVNAKGKTLVYAVIALEDMKKSELEVVAVSRGIVLKDCGETCTFDAGDGYEPNRVRFIWWTKVEDANTRSTFFFQKKSNQWMLNLVSREDWDESGLNSALVVSPRGRRSISVRMVDGNTVITGRNGPPLKKLLFQDFDPVQHWPEKAPAQLK